MCESKVVLLENGKKTILMDAAARIRIAGRTAVCINITGEEIKVENVDVKEMNLMKHEILLERGR